MPPQRVSTVSNGNTILFPPHQKTLLLLYSFFYDNPLFYLLPIANPKQ